MNPRLLQLGAEVLGWEWRPGSPWSSDPACGDHVYIPGYQTVSAHAYWLTAYMAEALIERVWSLRNGRDDCPVDIYEGMLLWNGLGCCLKEPRKWGLFPPSIRIAAALVALGRITQDEAREMVG